ncbi:hypothetical protein DRQ20_04660, partial [bacterium]
MMGWFSRVKNSIRWKISIFITVFFLFLFLLSGTVVYVFFTRNLEKVFYETNLSFSRISGEEIGRIFEEYFSGGFPYFEERVNLLKKMNPHLEKIQIFSTNGYILYDSHLGKIKKEYKEEEVMERIKKVSVTRVKKGNYFEVVVPIMGIWGRHLYSVRFIYSFEKIKRIKRKLGWGIFLGILLAGLTIFYVSYFASKMI